MRLGYLLREAWRGISRRTGGFLLAATVVAVCITLLSVFLVVTVNVMALVRTAGERGEMYAFVTDEAGSAPEDLLARAAALDGVRAVRFVSREEALQELRGDLGPDADLLDALDENPLPASIRLSLAPDATTGDALAGMEQKLRLLPGVVEVWSGKETLAQLSRALRTVTVLDLALLVLVAVSSVFIIFQAIESSISSRRREIEIMELVGATPAAVRFPFLLEGMIQGVAGGAAAFLAVLLLYRIVKAIVPAPGLPLLAVLALDVVLGLLLGLAGALIAVARRDSGATPVVVSAPRRARREPPARQP
ncbi:FtsX-like permease family protein [candidate division WOR-3 bacterium]|nr:FtsX-like permease family protein [candidate division WOR-3 bacterium]